MITGRTRTKDETVADTLRFCAMHADTEAESELIAWVTEHIADALASRPTRARFDRDAFMRAADWHN